MRVTVRSELCQGHGLCYGQAAGIFEDDEVGHALARVAEPSDLDQQVRARGAAEHCPEQAIDIVE